MKTDRPAFAFGRRFAVVLLIAVLIAGLGFCRKKEDIDATEMVLAGETPLAKAAAHGDIKAIGKLIDDGAEVDTKDTLGRTPLHIAAFYGNSRTSAFLISKGADVNAQDRIGMTPLHVAVISGGIREVEALLEKKPTSTSGRRQIKLSCIYPPRQDSPSLPGFYSIGALTPTAKMARAKTHCFTLSRTVIPRRLPSFVRRFPETQKRP
mgnify:CR=1 FL=1